MNYYKTKRQAYTLIDSMLANGNTEEKIIMVVMNRFGFGTRFVMERINIVKKVVKNVSRESGPDKTNGKRSTKD